MDYKISWSSVRHQLIQGTVGIGHAAYSGASGYGVGHVFNVIDRFIHPVKSALGKPAIVDPLHGAICGASFVAIDRLFHIAIQTSPLSENVKTHTITNIIRMTSSTSLAALATSMLFPVSFTMAAALIITNFVAITIFASISNSYSSLFYKKEGGGGAEQKDPTAEIPLISQRRVPAGG